MPCGEVKARLATYREVPGSILSSDQKKQTYDFSISSITVWIHEVSDDIPPYDMSWFQVWITSAI